MNQFQLYFNLGIQHILDLKGFDHILFVLALAVVYMIKDWGRILVLVTAFTIGHSLTLALATLKVIQINTDLVEFWFLLPLLSRPCPIFSSQKALRERGFKSIICLHSVSDWFMVLVFPITWLPYWEKSNPFSLLFWHLILDLKLDR